jgi:hypothetical protein
MIVQPDCCRAERFVSARDGEGGNNSNHRVIQVGAVLDKNTARRVRDSKNSPIVDRLKATAACSGLPFLQWHPVRLFRDIEG